jgi:lysophospholipase L1-like esterase
MTTRRQAIPLIAGLPAAAGLFAIPDTKGAGGASPLKIEPRSKLVMIGDSITDTDRARPVGEGLRDALGKGYVAMVDALLGAVYPEYALRIVNMGISGNTVRDLEARWQSDVLDLKPDWVSIMIGTNDVWRQFDSPTRPEKAVPQPEYEQRLEALVTRTKTETKGLVLMTPFYLEPSRTDGMRAQMDRYGAAVKAIARRQSTLFVDTQAAFDELMKHDYPATIAWDRVHPNAVGAMVLARAFVNAIGFSWTR